MRWFYILILAVFGASAAFGNLLQNEGFEVPMGHQAVGNWMMIKGTFGIEDWNTPPEGLKAGYFRGGGNEYVGIRQETEPDSIQAEVEYRLTGIFRNEKKWKPGLPVTFKLEFFDGQRKLLSSETLELQLPSNGKWLEKGLTAKAPANSSYAQVVIETANSGKEWGCFGVDGVVLVKKP